MEIGDPTEIPHNPTPETDLWSCVIYGAWRSWRTYQDIDDFLWLYGPDDPDEVGSLTWICLHCGFSRKTVIEALEKAGDRLLPLGYSFYEELYPTHWRLQRGRLARNQDRRISREAWTKKRKESWSVPIRCWIQTALPWGNLSPWKRRRFTPPYSIASPQCTG